VSATRETLLALLDGTEFANALMPWGRPGPIRLPDDAGARARLVDVHIAGEPADVLYSPNDREPETMHVEVLEMAAFTPDAIGLVHWLALDLDAADHGPSGLADPVAAMRCIASAADRAGLFSGLLTARSRGGRGRHVWLLLPEPVTLDDAVFGIAALTVQAYKIAIADVADYAAQHAFRRPNGSIAAPGDSGAVEQYPYSTERPAIGWALALPAAGAYRECDGGAIVDPYGDQPYELESVPKCDAGQWTRFLSEAKEAYKPKTKPVLRPARSPGTSHDPLDRIDPKARQFLDGQTSQGARNSAAFTTACSLLGFGVAANEVERLILIGAAGCGLPEREARASVRSAIMAMRRKGAVA
jgi:hypothetical protein